MRDMSSVELPKYQPKAEQPLATEDHLKAADVTTINRLKNLAPEKARHALRLSAQKAALTAGSLYLLISSGCGNVEKQSVPPPTLLPLAVSELPGGMSSSTIDFTGSRTATEAPTTELTQTPTITPEKVYILRDTISAENNREVLEAVYKMFDPSLVPYLKSIPILKSKYARTAFAHTSRHLKGKNDLIYIGVSPDWDNKASQSSYWEKFFSKPPYDMKPDDPVFNNGFKVDLLSHEYLHVVEDHLKLDIDQFFEVVKEWYQGDVYGDPSTNRVKMVLWWDLYKKEEIQKYVPETNWKLMKYNRIYRRSIPGREEMAYIFGTIVYPQDESLRKSRLREIPNAILDFFEGIINPDILELKAS